MYIRKYMADKNKLGKDKETVCGLSIESYQLSMEEFDALAIQFAKHDSRFKKETWYVGGVKVSFEEFASASGCNDPNKTTIDYVSEIFYAKTPQDILNLGYEEYLYPDAITIIEWPERLKFLLPKEFLKIKLCIKDKHQRDIQFVAKGLRYKQLLGKISEDIRN